MAKNGTPLEWALEKVSMEPMSGCWLWMGSYDKDGYGKFCFSPKSSGTGKKNSVRAHRFIYEGLRGPIPAGLVTDHKCRVPCCCNPDHIEIVTVAVNTARGVAVQRSVAKKKAITHCPYGHAYEGRNLIVYGNSRQCRTCRDRRVAAFYAKRRVDI